MKKDKIFLGLAIVIAIFFSSCKAGKFVPFFQDVTPEVERYKLASHYNLEQVIQPGDVLNINITSISSMLQNEFSGDNNDRNNGEPRKDGMSIFNKREQSMHFGKNVKREFDEEPQNDLLNSNDGAYANEAYKYYTNYKMKNYLVDDSGYIILPVIGNVRVAGLTWLEVKKTIEDKLKAYVTDPLVEINSSVIKVTILGEVRNPGVITAINDRMSILEALGRVGDMTVYGNRRHVVVVRSNGNNIEFCEFDFTKKDILMSPFFWLRNNDAIYISPNPTKAREAGYGKWESMSVSLGSLLISIISLIAVIGK